VNKIAPVRYRVAAGRPEGLQIIDAIRQVFHLKE
jgi:hypothetical protein